MADPFEAYPVVGFSQPLLGGTQPSPREAQDIGDAIIAGLQSSAMGLAKRGKLPDMQLGEDAPWYQRIASGAANVAADLPLSIAGAFAGAPVGAAAGSAVPVLGTAAGGVVGAGAGAFAVPMALREALITAYTHNHAASWEGIWDIARNAIVGGAKGAVIGGATAGAGRFVSPLVAPVAGRAVLAGELSAANARRVVDATAFGTELSALTVSASALEGKMPTAQDFMDNAVLLGGIKGAVAIARGMRGVYGETGKTPEEVARDAQANPAILEQLKSDELPEAYKPLALDERVKASIDADPRPEMLRKMLMNDGTPTPLGTPPLDRLVKTEYLTDQDTLKGVIRAAEQVYADAIEQQTRGVVTNKATAAAALRSVANGDAIEHAIGTAENAAQLYARADVLKAVLDDAYAKAAKLAGIPEAELTPAMKLEVLASNEKVGMVYAEYRGARAEAGRALQIFQKIKRDNSLIGDAEALIKAAERKGPLQGIAAAVRGMDTVQFADFIKNYNEATTAQKVLEVWKSAILTGPQTHLANLAGNIMKWSIEVPESILAATFTAAKRLIAGDPLTMAQYKARAFAPVIGWQLGTLDALKVAAEVWKQEGAHLEKADVYKQANTGTFGKIVQYPFKALQVGDVMFRTPAERGEAYIMAVDRAVEEGWNPATTEGRAQIMKYVNDPAFGLEGDAAEAAVKRVQEAGAEAVFAQKLGPHMQKLHTALIGTPYEFAGYIIPFFRTPANLLSWAVQHIPGLNFLSGRWRADYEAGGDRQARALARVTTGAALMLTAYNLADQGLLTGGGLFNKEENRTKVGAGWQPYSIKIGDKYYSYQRIEPLAKVLGLAADSHDMWQKMKDEGEKAKLVSMTVLMFGNATISTTYLSGLSNAMQSIVDPERYGTNFLEQYASSTPLTPKLLGQTVTALDPYKREVDGIMEAVQSQLPFLREKLMPKRDVWGEPIQNNKWFDVMPVQVSEASKDKVKTEAMRLQLALSTAPKFVLERGPFKSKEKRIDLTAEQRDVFGETMGKNAMTILAPIVNAPDWENIPDFAKAAIYQRIFEGTRKQGQYAALPPEDAARMQIREQIIGKILQQTEQAQTPARRVK